jgi:hypothetical protein
MKEKIPSLACSIAHVNYASDAATVGLQGSASDNLLQSMGVREGKADRELYTIFKENCVAPPCHVRFRKVVWGTPC